MCKRARNAAWTCRRSGRSLEIHGKVWVKEVREEGEGVTYVHLCVLCVLLVEDGGSSVCGEERTEGRAVCAERTERRAVCAERTEGRAVCAVRRELRGEQCVLLVEDGGSSVCGEERTEGRAVCAERTERRAVCAERTERRAVCAERTERRAVCAVRRGLRGEQCVR